VIGEFVIAVEPRAQALDFQQVVVIDEDLAKSGSGSVERSGFGHLLTAVCQRTVGAIFALEASRPHEELHPGQGLQGVRKADAEQARPTSSDRLVKVFPS
jgi:hypothetical protein